MSKKSLLSKGEEEIFVDQVGLDFNNNNSPSNHSKIDDGEISPGKENEEEAKKT